MVVTNCVLCVFKDRHRRNWPPTVAAFQFPLSQYYYCWVQQLRHWSATFTNHQCCAFHECCTNQHCCSSPSATFTNGQCCAFQGCCTNQHCCAFYCCALYCPRVLCQSTLLHLLQVHHSPISSVMPSTRIAPIVTVVLLQLHHSTVLLHLLAAILCHVIMLLDNSISSNNFATYVNTPCRLFNCIVKI